MLDIQFIREHADVVKESQRKRGESVELVDEVLRSDEVRRSSLKEFEAARAQQKEIGKKVAAAPADEKAKLIAATKELSQKVSEYKAAADAAAEENVRHHDRRIHCLCRAFLLGVLVDIRPVEHAVDSAAVVGLSLIHI